MVLNGVTDKRFLTFDDRLSNGRYIRDKVDADTGEIKRNYTIVTKAMM
jgi:ribulose 1,5-bisphosphate carboxylase large subunit-like protein